MISPTNFHIFVTEINNMKSKQIKSIGISPANIREIHLYSIVEENTIAAPAPPRCEGGLGYHFLQIGNGRHGPFGRDPLHLSIIGWSDSLGQNLGERIVRKHEDSQYRPVRARDFRPLTAFSTASISRDSG